MYLLEDEQQAMQAIAEVHKPPSAGMSWCHQLRDCMEFDEPPETQDPGLGVDSEMLMHKDVSAEGEGGSEAAGRSTLGPLMEEAGAFRAGDVIEIIEGKLSVTAHADEDDTIRHIKARPDIFYFSSELHESYVPFCLDFGPVNVGKVVEFCEFFSGKINDPRLRKRHVTYYTSTDPGHMTNTAFLISSWLLLEKGCSPEDAVRPFVDKRFGAWTIPFRDATYLPQDFPLTLLDCMKGLASAVRLGWFNPREFDLGEYDALDNPGTCDMHEVVKGKFIAFKGPISPTWQRETGIWGLPPKAIMKPLLYKGVKAVIRLNEPQTYDAADFEEGNIAHFDCYFDDCTVPPPEIVERFLDICDSTEGMIAVHCLAGLGRTGTLIALWMMRKHGLTAKECIAWLRICRPGSVIGPQQHFLQMCEKCPWDGNKVMLESVPGEGPEQQRRLAEDSRKLAKQVARGMQRRAEHHMEAGAKGESTDSAPEWWLPTEGEERSRDDSDWRENLSEKGRGFRRAASL